MTGDEFLLVTSHLWKKTFNNLIGGSVYFQYISWNLHRTSHVRVLEEMREILMLTLVLSVKAAESNNSTVSHRQSKFLNLFSVIRFSNTPCSSKNGLNGTCYTDKQCQGRKKKTKMSIDTILRYILQYIFLLTDWCVKMLTLEIYFHENNIIIIQLSKKFWFKHPSLTFGVTISNPLQIPVFDLYC